MLVGRGPRRPGEFHERPEITAPPRFPSPSARRAIPRPGWRGRTKSSHSRAARGLDRARDRETFSTYLVPALALGAPEPVESRIRSVDRGARSAALGSRSGWGGGVWGTPFHLSSLAQRLCSCSASVARKPSVKSRSVVSYQPGTSETWSAYCRPLSVTIHSIQENPPSM
jgi:hypothetical protein